jgi:hypothetical protein
MDSVSVSRSSNMPSSHVCFASLSASEYWKRFDRARWSSHHAPKAGTFMIVVECVAPGAVPLEEILPVLPSLRRGFGRQNHRRRHKRQDSHRHARNWARNAKCLDNPFSLLDHCPLFVC